MYNNNIILTSDSYKISHARQYPPGTESVYSYFEARKGGDEHRYQDIVFFGLQIILKKYLLGQVVTKEHIEEADLFCKAHFGRNDMFNRKGWEHILTKHNGRLPISIKCIPEGTPVSRGNVLMTVENTDPEAFWLTNYLETLLVQTWYPSTVATQSRDMKKVIVKYLKETADLPDASFKLHDFGFRGVSSVETAGIGGCSHLVNFMGTDTIAGLIYAKDYYGCDMAGYSIPAAEHSTITSWGRENESKAYSNMLEKYPNGLVAVVSDSYDLWHAIKEIWGKELKHQVLNHNGTLIVRPDSGHPPGVVYKTISLLGESFGFTTNSKGYKVLNNHVRVIQGDGIDYDMVGEILELLKNSGYSAENIAFGSGGALLQKLNRDTARFAFKCSSIRVNGEERDVFKQPIDEPTKISKKGRLKLVKENDAYVTKTINQLGIDELVEVFRDGKLLKDWTFDEVRQNAAIL